MTTTLDELVALAPNTEVLTVFFCDNIICNNSFRSCTTKRLDNDDYEWSIQLQCVVCNSVWWICRSCPLRKKIQRLSILRRHQYSNHRVNQERHTVIKDNVVTRRRKRITLESNGSTNTDVCTAIVPYVSRAIVPYVASIEQEIHEENMVIFDVEQGITDDYQHKKDFLQQIRSKIIDSLSSSQSVHDTNASTKEYYSFDILSSGNKFLIANMWSRENGNFDDVFRSLSDEEVTCQILISEFARSLSRNQQRDFGKVIDYILDFYVRQKDKAVCSLPRNIADIRRMYTDGTDSISKRLPIPNIVKINNHSYVSLRDCVADFLFSNNIQLKFLQQYHNDTSDFISLHHMSLFGNERIREIIQDSIDRVESQDCPVADFSNVLLLFLKIWSDDFDPNSSIKSNRQSVWVKTVTIFALSTDGKNISRTYPVATSPKGSDHEAVENKFLNELVALRSGKLLPYFDRNTNGIVYVHADIYCVSCDQPERRTNLMISAGNSIHHKRFGYVVDYVQCQEIIRSCDKCTTGIMLESEEYEKNRVVRPKHKSLWRGVPCEHCTSWMYFEDHPLLSYIPDKNYPGCKKDEYGSVNISRITKSMLVRMIKEVEMSLQDKTWTSTTCKAYLRTAGLHTKAITKIMDAATNHCIYQEAEENKEQQMNTWIQLRKDYENDPRKYQSWTLPSSWYNFDNVQLYVDAPMHLVMLGVGKSVYIKVAKWLKIRMQATEFKESTKGILDQLKVYSLDWCKILLYPHSSTDKFGGWVAENFLALIRITNWFYSLLSLLRKPSQDVPNLETPPVTWNMKQNIFWLELRGLPTDGNAKLLKERVMMYLDLDNVPPIVENTAVNVTDIMKLLDALTDMVGMMMSSNTRLVDIDYVELIIRKFLILYDKVDNAMTKKKVCPAG